MLIVVLATIGSIAALILTMPALRSLMQFAALTPVQLLLIAILSVVVLWLLEQLKRRFPGLPRQP